MMKEMTMSSIYSRISLLALPISSARFVDLIASFIAMMMIAKLGTFYLAAAALAVSTYITILTVVATSLYAVGILVSHERGKQSSQYAIGAIGQSGICCSLLMGALAGLILWHCDTILLILGQSKNLVSLCQQYFHFAALSITPTLLLTTLSQFHNGIDKPKFTMIISVIGLPLRIAFSYLFIFGKLGMPQLGLAGVMAAFFVVQLILLLGVFIYFLQNRHIKQYHIFTATFAIHRTTCMKILKIGLPIGIQFGGEIAAMTTATLLLGHFGVAALAASQIVAQYALLVVMISLGLSQALSILISEAYAKREINMIRQYLQASICLISGIFFIVNILFFCFPHQLTTLFSQQSNDDIYHLATVFFMISGVILYIDGIRNLLSGALRGLQDSKTPMVIGVGSLWFISIPLCYLVAFHFHGGPIGLRISYGLGFAIASMMLWRLVYKKLADFKTSKNLLNTPSKQSH